MLEESVQEKVRKATVRTIGRGGQAVLLHGGMIVTAAHCIDFKCDVALTLGGVLVEEIETREGPLKASVLAIEPVSDIAVLGPLDAQQFPQESIQFDTFCNRTDPVRLCFQNYPLFERIQVFLLTHEGNWVTGEAQQCQDNAECLSIGFSKRVCGGTSGGPIVNEAGELVAVCSNVSSNHPDIAGPQPRPHLTLPVWVRQMIERDQDEGDSASDVRQF